MAGLQLRKDDSNDALHAGGSVTYRVHDGARWIGWVGDGRKFTGSGYGARKWWACWREDGDTAARRNPGLRYTTRQAAVDALAAYRAGEREQKPLPGPAGQIVARGPDGTSDRGYARWGQAPVVAPGEPFDPVPTVYSERGRIEIADDTWLDLATAEALCERIQAAIAYERRRAADEALPLRIAIDADCPKCGWPERNLDPATGVFACRHCPYTSRERNA